MSIDLWILYIELPHVLLLHLALLHQNKGKNDIEFTTPKKKKNKGMVISIT